MRCSVRTVPSDWCTTKPDVRGSVYIHMYFFRKMMIRSFTCNIITLVRAYLYLIKKTTFPLIPFNRENALMFYFQTFKYFSIDILLYIVILFQNARIVLKWSI